METLHAPQGTKKLAPVSHSEGTIRLADVIALHGKFAHPDSLPDNIGDAYLLATNPVARAVREQALALGVRFTKNEPAEYFSYPMMSLDRILDSGIVPYRANFPWLLELERRAPGRFGFKAVRAFNIHYNFLMHECAHYLAHRSFHGNSPVAALPRNEENFFLAILGESFANATESLSSAFVAGEIGGYFHQANSYQSLPVQDLALILTAARAHGFEKTFQAMILHFLYANFFYSELGHTELRKIAAALSLPEECNYLRGLTKVTADFSETFRTDTSVLFQMGQGFSEEQIGLLGGDPLDWLARHPEFAASCFDKIRPLAAGLTQGLDAEYSL